MITPQNITVARTRIDGFPPRVQHVASIKASTTIYAEADTHTAPGVDVPKMLDGHVRMGLWRTLFGDLERDLLSLWDRVERNLGPMSDYGSLVREFELLRAKISPGRSSFENGPYTDDPVARPEQHFSIVNVQGLDYSLPHDVAVHIETLRKTVFSLSDKLTKATENSKS